MPLSAENTTTVTCLTSPADTELDYDGRDLFYPFQTILGISLGDRTIGLSTIVSEDRDTEERELVLPELVATRLTESAHILLDWRRFYNCHRFSRVMAGVLAAERLGYYPEPSWHYQPPSVYVDELEPVKNLVAGASGIVGIPDPKPERIRDYGADAHIPHSVVGLGEDVDESLHVHTMAGLLGIVNNNLLRDFYGDYASSSNTARLHEVPVDSLC